MEKKAITGRLVIRRRMFSWYLLFSSCSMPRSLCQTPYPGKHINLGLGYKTGDEYTSALDQYEIALKKLPVAIFYIAIFISGKGIWKGGRKLMLSNRKEPGPMRKPWLIPRMAFTYDRAEKLKKAGPDKAVPFRRIRGLSGTPSIKIRRKMTEGSLFLSREGDRDASRK